MNLLMQISAITATLLVATAAIGAEPFTPPHPRIVIDFPRNHAHFLLENGATAWPELTFDFHVLNFRIPQDGYIFITGEKLDSGGFAFASPRSRSIIAGDMEPGSHFWTWSLHHPNGTVVVDATPTVHHVEILVPQDLAWPQYGHILRPDERAPRVLVNLAREASSNTIAPPQKTPLCFVMSTSALFDGQKKIWLQVMEALARRERHPWNVQVKSFEDVVEGSPQVLALRQLNTSIHSLPLRVPRIDIHDLQLTESDVMTYLLQTFEAAFPEVDELVAMKTSEHLSSRLKPQWISHFWQHITDGLRSCADGIVVFGNSRSESDRILAHAARSAGAQSVIMELANVEPVPIRVDVLVAPSHFALMHPSVEDIASQKRHVMVTGVNTEVFRPGKVKPSSSTFVIGFVGRLTTEKSLGLLLEAMRSISHHCSNCLLQIIGAGPLQGHLRQLGIEWGAPVDFMGGIYSEQQLANYLGRMHVFVSSRFLETLGIAPLEAMSCGVPVVGFASGGVGEYLEHEVNGLVVQDPYPSKIAEAVLRLRHDEELRERLGVGARETIRRRFALRRGADQYLTLYERLTYGVFSDIRVPRRDNSNSSGLTGSLPTA